MDRLVWLLAIIAMLGLACTGVGLQPPPFDERTSYDNLLTVRGEFCTQPDSEVVFPVKVLFVVDQSTSLQCTDSTDWRFSVLTMLLSDLFDNPATSVGFIGFSSWSRRQRFTRNMIEIHPFLDPAAGLGEATDYQGALATAVEVLEDDMVAVGPAERARTRYVVVFVSDGVPNPRCLAGCEDDQTRCANGEDDDGDGAIDGADLDCANIDDTSLHPDNDFAVCNTDLEIPEGEYVDMNGVCPAYNQPDQIKRRVRDILELGDTYSTGGVDFNTVLLYSPQPIVESVCPDAAASFGMQEEPARALLRAMALEGEGVFRDANLGSIDNGFLDFDYRSLEAPQAMTGLFVFTQHARIGAEGHLPDSDGDGLADEVEHELGADPFARDSDLGGGDGYSDAFETAFAAWGFDALDPNIPAVPCSSDFDLDGDGLLGCEEEYLGSDSRHPDSDGDGILDAVELFLGTEPTRDDAYEDLDFDGLLNIEEARGGTHPAVPDADRYRHSAMRYRVFDLGRQLLPDGDETRSCYEFAVRDIPLVVTPFVVDRGLNRVFVYALEQPAQLASSRAEVSVACFEVFYRGEYSKDPEDGIVDVTSASYEALLSRVQTEVDGLLACNWFDGSFRRDDIDRVIDQCLPEAIQLGRFNHPESEVYALLHKYVAPNTGLEMPMTPAELFVPIEIFAPDRDCHRLWELELLFDLFERILDACACDADGDETASPCCP